MQLIITDAWFSRGRVLHLKGWQVAVGLCALGLVGLLLTAFVYHAVVLKGAREGWPVVSQIVKLVVRDEFAQRDRYMQENIDAMAQKVGELQARLLQLDALGERVSGLAGLQAPADAKAQPGAGASKAGTPAGQSPGPGRGGPLIGGVSLTSDQLRAVIDSLDEQTRQRTDLFTVVESRLFDAKMRALMQPTQHPVATANLGSGFGWRLDPITGRSALHTGLDFQAEPGTPIVAAAGGLVVVQEYHPAYGNMVEVDHGNQVITRYAHASQVFVKVGDLVKRGQKIAAVGSSGRSTGPHLHFEVLVQGVFQDPAPFLAQRDRAAPLAADGRESARALARR